MAPGHHPGAAVLRAELVQQPEDVAQGREVRRRRHLTLIPMQHLWLPHRAVEHAGSQAGDEEAVSQKETGELIHLFALHEIGEQLPFVDHVRDELLIPSCVEGRQIAQTTFRLRLCVERRAQRVDFAGGQRITQETQPVDREVVLGLLDVVRHVGQCQHAGRIQRRRWTVTGLPMCGRA